uniref:Translation initiation factor IF-3, chloroplastic n=1 Tax=Gracilaria vermiculophylla TaxID=2608709 RepID=A0A345U8W0_9FLOR|nr:translation initiation factor 3 [Gracilaria vermiculophylla]AXI96896.1 translation initiation factor 3 [Gracilaria vermiculophylla]QXU75107.1 translation initiation factor 3 [Gracilaria vermiculophylla]WDZ67966.1 translation initiation factor 3 [Gracilaria vermiculophylla]
MLDKSKKERKRNETEPLINERIRYNQIRLIGVSGSQLGIYSSGEALNMALNAGLDLVLISEKSNPPVCRIIDYGKYKFTQEKKAKEAKKKQHNVTIKEVKMRYKIDVHDYNVRISQALRFLKSGDKVKANVIFRGREIQHAKLAIELLNKMAEDLNHIAEIQQPPAKDGKNIVMILSPKKV